MSFTGETSAVTNACFPSCITFGLLAAALGPMIFLVRKTPEEIPADEIAQEQDHVIERKQLDA